MPLPEALDYTHTDHIVCPHCGAKDMEFCDYPESLDRDGDTTLVECTECENSFGVTIYISYTYTSSKKPSKIPK